MATKLKQTALDLVPLAPTLGAEVRGLDLTREIDAGTREALRAAFAEYSVLLVRGQNLSEDDQFRFARQFGEIADRVKPPVEKRAFRADPENRMQLITDRVDEQGQPLGSLGDGEMWFHTDKCYVEKPHRGSFLYAVEIPSEGGHTKFASLYEAYRRIPDALRRRLEGRRVLQLYDYTKDGMPDLDQRLDDLLHYWQPIFVTNPDSGRRALYVSRLMSVRIEGMDDAESREVLDTLSDIVEAPDNIYEHAWRPGDIIAWDNLSSVHARTAWPADERRTLRRCTIKGGALS